MRLYDVDNNWRLRKDVEARNLRWTITDTCISPDQKFLLYSSISPIVHLVRILSGAIAWRPVNCKMHLLCCIAARSMLTSAAAFARYAQLMLRLTW